MWVRHLIKLHTITFFKEHFEILQRSGLKDCCLEMFTVKVGSKYCGAIKMHASHKIEMQLQKLHFDHYV